MPVPKSWIFFFVAVVLIIFGIYFTQPEAPSQTPTVEESTAEQTRGTTFQGMLGRGGDAIYVEDQMVGTLMVQVGFVVLSVPGFVVIYDDAAGVPGSVIGSSELLQDGGEHLVVNVDDSLVDEQVYYAMLYHDDGDGVFDVERDAQATDFEDSVVLMSFLASENAQPESEAVSP